MKIYLNSKEKSQLNKLGRIVVYREPYSARTSKSSILNGIGLNHIWDKIDRVWIFGDTKEYIDRMINVGRRAVDYPDNGRNTCNGAKWWNFDRSINEYGEIGSIYSNGRNHKITFSIINAFICELKPDKEDARYNRVTFAFTLELKDN